MSSGTSITFRPLTEADLPLLHEWLNNPDVARWYGLGIENTTYPTLEQVIENYTPRIGGQLPTFGYIIEADGRPVGHIQAYRIGDYPIYARSLDYDDDAWGIDLFVGEDDVRGGGFGTRAVDRFVETEIFSRPGVEVAVIAPNPQPARHPLLRKGPLHPRQDGLCGDGGRGGVRHGATEDRNVAGAFDAATSRRWVRTASVSGR